MKRLLLILTTAFLLGTATAQTPTVEDEITPDEVKAPPAAWNDAEPWGGDSPPWFEDPASVDCGDRKACRDAMAVKTESRTETRA